MNCVKCGNPLTEGAKFCCVCGMPVPVEPPADPVVSSIPYIPAKMEGGNIIVPVGRKYRILCPNCGTITTGIKNDTSVGYVCPSCNNAYAYMGQVLIYRMGAFHPLYIARMINIMIDGCDYGEIANHESVRVLVGPGSHMVSCNGYGLRTPMQYKIDVTPEYNTFAFKFNLIYNGPFTYPGRGTSNELNPCAPEEIPNI